MKPVKLGVLTLVAILVFAFVGHVVADEAEKLEVKAGQKYFVCSCGEKCPCNAVSKVAGKCPCGKDMVEAPATKVDPIRTYHIPSTVEGGYARFKAEGWEKEQEFDIIAKYSCPCGKDMKKEKLDIPFHHM